MARTSGHGNPNWTRDETILALDLYLSRGKSALGAIDVDVKALSSLLRSMPYHVDASKKPTFRNPDGVAFKLQNLRSVETGGGLTNTSKVDRQVWEELGHNPSEVARLARAIRQGMQTYIEPTGDEIREEFHEGRIITALHVRRERDPQLRKRVLAERRMAAGLSCDCCGLGRSDLASALEQAIFEVHHINPLALTGERRTTLRDVALLCANCHRLTHALIVERRRWVAIEEVAELVPS